MKVINDITKEWEDTIDVCEMYLADLDVETSPELVNEALWDIKYYRNGLDIFNGLLTEGKEAQALRWAKKILKKGTEI
ncbi:MAG: hypothetical protein C0446_08465 [Chitinophaga sp.]|nr:hypothetical protein [Chitinophaga sp.]